MSELSEINKSFVMSGTVDLSQYDSNDFDRGAGVLKESIWIMINLFLFRFCPVNLSALKCKVLRLFGARIGENVTIKTRVNITFPWKLIIGNHVWLGEECWILNLSPVVIGNHVCISQRAVLCTGSHDYKRVGFQLITKSITLENGAWIGAGSWVGPGVTVGSHAVLAMGSVATRSLAPYGIYRGNPASMIRQRSIS